MMLSFQKRIFCQDRPIPALSFSPAAVSYTHLLHKTEVREIAEQHKFVNARKHDSQDICFVPDGDYARFMEDFTGKHLSLIHISFKYSCLRIILHAVQNRVKFFAHSAGQLSLILLFSTK